MGRDLSPNHLCPYLAGGKNFPVFINRGNSWSDILSAPPWLGSLLPWLPLIPSPSCPSLLAKLALSSLLALLAGVLLLQVLCHFILTQHHFLTCSGYYPGEQGGPCCVVALGLLWAHHEGGQLCRLRHSSKFLHKVINLLNDIKYLLNHLMWIHQVRVYDKLIDFFGSLIVEPLFSCCYSPLLRHCTEDCNTRREKLAGGELRMVSRRDWAGKWGHPPLPPN